MRDAKSRSTTIEGLPSKHTTVRAIPLLANLRHHLVHAPSVQLAVAHDTQLHPVLDRIALHRLERVVAVARDALVDREEHKFDAVVVPRIECFEDGGEHGGVLAAGGADCDAVAAAEEAAAGDGCVDLGFEDGGEAGFAEALVGLGTEDLGTGGFAVDAELGGGGVAGGHGGGRWGGGVVEAYFGGACR